MQWKTVLLDILTSTHRRGCGLVGMMVGSIVALVVLLVILIRSSHDGLPPNSSEWPSPPQVLRLFCASSNRDVVNEACREYRVATGVEIIPQYGSSQTLLSTIQVVQTGDLFLPADESYLDRAIQAKLISYSASVAKMNAVPVVRVGNPKSIRSFEDLLRADIKLSQANPNAAAVGYVTRSTLQKQNLWDQFDRATETYRTSVTEVANDVSLGSADVGIIFDAMLSTYPTLQLIHLDEFDGATAIVKIGVLRCSSKKSAAIKFADFLSDRRGGRVIYRRFGFEVPEDDDVNVDGDADSDDGATR